MLLLHSLGENMFGSSVLGLALIASPVSAAPQQIRYDSYADDGDMLYGGYFSELEGLGMNNCMAVVYSFEKEHFPLMPTGLKIFWAGEGAGVASEALMTIYIDWYEGEADADIMRAGMYSRLEQKTILITGVDLEGTWVDIDFERERMTFDFEPDVEGLQPITFGSVIVSACYDNRQTFPEIAMDTNGWMDEPPPVSDDDFIVGHETSKFRNLIQWNFRWDTLDTFLLEQFDFDGGGDFIMRLNIDAQYEVVDDAGVCTENEDWTVDSIQPAVATAGQSTKVLIRGDYNFPEGATVKLGSYDLADVSPNSDCGIQGRISKEIPAGTYDVVVSAPDGSERSLLGAITIEAAKKGGCTTVEQGPNPTHWWLSLMGLAVFVRRRD
jgi:hypothetical protein